MTNLLIIILLIVFVIGAGKALTDAMLCGLDLCGKVARLIDRIPNLIIILGALSFAILFTGVMISASHY